MAKSKFRGANLYRNQQALCSNMRWQFKRFWDNCLSHAEILEWRELCVFREERYQRLTEYYRAKVLTTFELLSDQLQAKLFWTHVIPELGHRWQSRTAAHDQLYQDRISEVIEHRGAHCYLAQIGRLDGLFVLACIPWQKEQLDLDLAEGLVQQWMLDVLRDPYGAGRDYSVRRYWPAYAANGVIQKAYEVCTDGY